jgi:hypothetical protein
MRYNIITAKGERMNKINPKEGFDQDVIKEMLVEISKSSNWTETFNLLKRWFDAHNGDTHFDGDTNTLCALDFATGCDMYFVFIPDLGYQVAVNYMPIYQETVFIDTYSTNPYVDMIMLFKCARSMAAKLKDEWRRHVED